MGPQLPPFLFPTNHYLPLQQVVEKSYVRRVILCYDILLLFFDRLLVLITFLAVLSILSRTCVPWLLKLMISLSSQVCLLVFHIMLKMGEPAHTCFCKIAEHMCAWDIVVVLICSIIKILSVQTNELYQLASVAFCLLVAWVSYAS